MSVRGLYPLLHFNFELLLRVPMFQPSTPRELENSGIVADKRRSRT